MTGNGERSLTRWRELYGLLIHLNQHFAGMPGHKSYKYPPECTYK